MLYGLKKKDRIFTVTKSYLHHEMDRGAKAAGVKRIRIHDLRHSHISLLIDMGFSAVAIADRVGHETPVCTVVMKNLKITTNKQLTSDNNRLREEIKDYKLLRKVFGSKQIDSLLEQARQSKQRGTRFRNKENER